MQTLRSMSEQDRPAENRVNFNLAFFFIRIPQFKCAAVGGQPILVEIGNKDEAVIELREVMLVKIDVHGEFAARWDLMQAATAAARIRNEPFDARNFF